MAQSLNIPVPTSAYRQPRRVLKNRSARRNRVQARPELTLVAPASVAHPQAGPVAVAPAATSEQSQTPGMATTSLANHHLSQAVLLDWLGSQPVAFHRVYVDVCGSVTAAVWLSMVLSLLDGPGKRQVDAQGIFRFSLALSHCEAMTGLTEREQRKAQRQLQDVQLLTVEGKKPGKPQPGFALDMNRLTQHLLNHSEALAQLLQHNDTKADRPLDVDALERRAQARASRRRA